MGAPWPSGVCCHFHAAFHLPVFLLFQCGQVRGLWIEGRWESGDLGSQFAAHEDLRWRYVTG